MQPPPVRMCEQTIAQRIANSMGFYLPWLGMFGAKIEPIEDEQ